LHPKVDSIDFGCFCETDSGKHSKVKTKNWFRIHSFIGVITGLMLFVICWSGTVLVFSHELDWLVRPAMRVQPQAEHASWGAIEAAARAAAPQSDIEHMSAPLNRRAVAQIGVIRPNGDYHLILVNPYTAEVQGFSPDYGVWRFFRTLHEGLFDIGGVGRYVVTIFALVIFLSLLSALCFLKRWWTGFLKRPRGRGRAFWSGLHRATGLWSLWFLFVIALTGVWYLYEQAQHDLVDGPLNYVSNPPHGAVSIPAPVTDPTLPKLPLDEVIAKAKQAWPGFEIGTVAYGWYSGGEDVVYLEGHTGGFSLVRDRANQMHLDPRTGEVIWQNSAGDLPPYWLWSNMADPLHFGNFGGLWGKAVWFAFGLLLCGLTLTGVYLHAKRIAGDAAGRHRWPGTMAAICVTLLVLAASVPAGFHEAREFYGPTIDGVKQLPTLAPGVKAVIIGWVAVTLAIIAGWVWLLWRASRGTAS